MKNSVRHLFLLLALFTVYSAAARESAQQIMAKCASVVNKAPSLDVKMVITSGGQSGEYTMRIARQKFRVVSPQVVLWYDGTTQWTYVKNNRELNITEPTQEELLECNPFAIINHYATAYTAKRLAGDGLVVELTSKDPDSNVRKAVLTIDSGTYLPQKAVVTMADGTTFAAIVKTVTKGGTPKASEFVYDKIKYNKIKQKTIALNIIKYDKMETLNCYYSLLRCVLVVCLFFLFLAVTTLVLISGFGSHTSLNCLTINQIKNL